MATSPKSPSSTSSDASLKTLTGVSYHLSELQHSLDSFKPFTTLTPTSPYKSSSELQDRVNVLEKQNLALRLALAEERGINVLLKEKLIGGRERLLSWKRVWHVTRMNWLTMNRT
jgi:uncharacterized protein with NAD-binding domain and iron-sulfur cluster